MACTAARICCTSAAGSPDARARNITVSCGAWASGRYISCDGSDARVLLTSPTTPMIRCQFLPFRHRDPGTYGIGLGKELARHRIADDDDRFPIGDVAVVESLVL